MKRPVLSMSPLRRELTDLVDPRAVDLPRHASTVYVWPTLRCTVGCAHCNFASPPILPREEDRRIGANPQRAADYVKAMGAWRVSLSGGGEPLDEPAFIEQFVKAMSVQGTADMEVITSGHSSNLTHEPAELLELWRHLWTSGGSTRRFLLRLSVDWFHADAVGLEPAAAWLRAAGPPRDWPETYVRSVLIGGDRTMPRLAELLQGELSEFEDYIQYIVLPTGARIPVYYKNLILDGRMSLRKLEEGGLALTHATKITAFQERFRDARGRIIQGRLYNGMEPIQLDGLATVIEADGRLEILESISPDVHVNVLAVPWQEAVDIFYRDPITHILLEAGTEGLVDVLRSVSIEPDPRVLARNQMYYVTQPLLKRPEVLDAATCGAILALADRHPGAYPSRAFDIARGYLRSHGLTWNQA